MSAASFRRREVNPICVSLSRALVIFVARPPQSDFVRIQQWQRTVTSPL